MRWRRDLRAALIVEGILTYAPHEAFKGRWDERAQAINDAAIQNADLMLIMSHPDWVSEGTDAEIKIAEQAGTLTKRIPPLPADPDLDKEAWDFFVSATAKMIHAWLDKEREANKLVS